MSTLTILLVFGLLATANVIKHDIRVSPLRPDSGVYQEGPTSPKPPETPKGMNGPSEFDEKIKQQQE